MILLFEEDFDDAYKTEQVESYLLLFWCHNQKVENVVSAKCYNVMILQGIEKLKKLK